MKKILFAFILLISCGTLAFADTRSQFESAKNALPNIEISDIKQTTIQQKQDIIQPASNPSSEKQQTAIQIKKSQTNKKAFQGFNPKSSGLTNYQYDDMNYKYYKFEKYIKDNIEYSKSGSTTLY